MPEELNTNSKFLIKDEEGFERVVFAEVLIPDTLNVFGDFHTKENVREIAYRFMAQGFDKDVDHDNISVADRVHTVESFIARENDPDFIEGSWVIGMLIRDDEIWEKVKSGEINGYSWEGLSRFLYVDMIVPSELSRTGKTEPDLDDGHIHNYFVILDEDGRVIDGGTDYTNGHSHPISQHTFTDEEAGHMHRYNLLIGADGY